MFIVSLLRNSEIIIANPTAASAAASAITKKTSICPCESPRNEENDTKDRLTEFSISSIDIKIIIAFLLIKTPVTPIENNMMLNNKKYSNEIIKQNIKIYFQMKLKIFDTYGFLKLKIYLI